MSCCPCCSLRSKLVSSLCSALVSRWQQCMRSRPVRTPLPANDVGQCLFSRSLWSGTAWAAQGRGRDWWCSVSIDGWTFGVGRQSQAEAECPASIAAWVRLSRAPSPSETFTVPQLKQDHWGLIDTKPVYNNLNSSGNLAWRCLCFHLQLTFFKLWDYCKLTEELQIQYKEFFSCITQE